MKYFAIILLGIYIFLLYRPFLIQGNLPIPADTIAGLYHPWRDNFQNEYPSNVPFKNFQITDPVRQQYPWRQLAIEQLRLGTLPVWNPYSFSGTPLLGNFQSAVFYPLNILFFIFSFNFAWSFLVLLQLILGASFMFLFLRNQKLHPLAIAIGCLAWIGSGFFVAWQQWNTVVHTVIWLPLILLAIDKIFTGKKFPWALVFIFSLTASFFAGYLQPFFYLFVITGAYILFRLIETKKARTIFFFAPLFIIFFLLSIPQLLPTFQFISLSARDLDQSNWIRSDWFLPWQNLIQLIAPDFFGNPATLNYFGVWNYQEFVSYIGIAPLVLAVVAIFTRYVKTTFFFTVILLTALLFALPTIIGKVPFIFQIPLISTSQPSRLVFVICFCLSVLAAFGADSILREAKIKAKQLVPTLILVAITLGLYFFAINFNPISQRNMLLPVVTAILVTLLFVSLQVLPKFKNLIFILLIFLTIFDLWRFGSKFLPFTEPKFLFKKTEVTNFLVKKSQEGIFRIAAVDDRVFPPDFSVAYNLQFVSGYDPLYVKRYGEFIASVERNKPDPNPPFGFNRIIAPKNYNSKFFDLLGVRYLLSLDPIISPKYNLVFEEGQTKVYENSKYLPRAFFAKKVTFEDDKQKIFNQMFKPTFNPETDAIISGIKKQSESSGSAQIKSYKENEVLIETDGGGYLILTDPLYPIWHAEIDGTETEIFPANYVFRGVLVPEGKHQVRFFAKLF